MKVYFLNPPFAKSFSRGERSPQVAKGGTLYFPVWLTQAAAYIEKQGVEISLMDAVADEVPLQNCIDWIRSGSPDCLVIEVCTASWINDIKTIGSIRANFPDMTIILVGTHVSALPESSLRECEGADIVVNGEFEIPLKKIINAVRNGEDWSDVPGISFWEGESVKNTGPAELLEDLDEIPYVSELYKRFLNYKNYFFAPASSPGIMLMIGRGCPFHCSWCIFNQTLHGRRYRHRSPEKIIGEFEYIIENFPDVKEIWIEDDTFTVDQKHVQDVCELIIHKKLQFAKHPFTWYCNARPPLDLETMKMMKQAGCRLFVTGFESGSTEMLRDMSKGYRVDQAEKFVTNTKKAGILIHGCFMVGNKGETKETMKNTLKYAKQLMPDSAQFYFVHPYPGTEYYDWAKENGYLNTSDFSQWLNEDGTHKCVLELPEVSSKELTDFCNTAYKEYHFNTNYLMMKLRQLFVEPQEGIRSLKSGMQYVGHLLSLR